MRARLVLSGPREPPSGTQGIFAHSAKLSCVQSGRRVQQWLYSLLIENKKKKKREFSFSLSFSLFSSRLTFLNKSADWHASDILASLI